jgi:iron complex outermembrane receptor protein
LGRRQNIVWGLGYRLIADQTNSNSGTPVQYNPKGRTLQIFSTFAQDEITLVKDRLQLTLGAKLEHNDYSDFEFQPNLLIRWTPHTGQTLWATASRAVKTPARGDRDLRINISAFTDPAGRLNLIALVGDPNYKPETLLAYEFGYRVQPSSRLSLDLATFYNKYNHLKTTEPGIPFFESEPIPHLLIPIRYGNLLRATTYGLEAATNWNVTERWKLSASYSWLQVKPRRDESSGDADDERAENSSPDHQFQVRSYLKFARNFEFDTSLYYVGRLIGQQIPGYARLDARLGWRLREGLDLSIGGQNLLDNRHPEFGSLNQGVVAGQVKLSFYGKVTWRF